jgi:hypothetical protein
LGRIAELTNLGLDQSGIPVPSSSTPQPSGLDPKSLGIKGSTQLEVFQGTVDAMAIQMKANPTKFWQDTLIKDGPVEIWIINGERYLYNGNHRFHAAVKAGVDIPKDVIRTANKTGSLIPTFLLKDLVWLPGFK